MLHDRPWKLSPVRSANELARRLTEIQYCLCQGFSLSRYHFLNDSKTENEVVYAVCAFDRFQLKQIETIDFTFMSHGEALHEIGSVLKGRYDFFEFCVIDTRRIRFHSQAMNCGCERLPKTV